MDKLLETAVQYESLIHGHECSMRMDQHPNQAAWVELCRRVFGALNYSDACNRAVTIGTNCEIPEPRHLAALMAFVTSVD